MSWPPIHDIHDNISTYDIITEVLLTSKCCCVCYAIYYTVWLWYNCGFVRCFTFVVIVVIFRLLLELMNLFIQCNTMFFMSIIEINMWLINKLHMGFKLLFDVSISRYIITSRCAKAKKWLNFNTYHMGTSLKILFFENRV